MTPRAKIVQTFYCDEGFALTVEDDMWVFKSGEECFFHQVFQGDLDPIWVYEDISQFDQPLAERFFSYAFPTSDD